MDHVVLTSRTIRRSGLVLIGLVIVGLLAGAVGWRATGGRWMTIESGSMGTAAPVGTLVLTRPVSMPDVRPGDIVSFRTTAGETYTHRVTKVVDGTLITKGDNNGTIDPYRTRSDDLVGKVVARWRAVGFLLKALPYLVVLLGLLWLITLRVKVPWRSAARLLGASLIVAGILVFQRPLVGAEVSSTAAARHTARAAVVSTGILPVEVRAAGGDSVQLRAGQTGVITGSQLNSRRQLPLVVAPHPTGWWWAAVIGMCAIPLLVGLQLGIRSAVG